MEVPDEEEVAAYHKLKQQLARVEDVSGGASWLKRDTIHCALLPGDSCNHHDAFVCHPFPSAWKTRQGEGERYQFRYCGIKTRCLNLRLFSV